VTAVIRNPLGTVNVQLLGVGAYRPQRVVDNHELCRTLDSSDEWIRARTGIVTRRWADPQETLIEMACRAGSEALSRADLDPMEVDCVLVATFTLLRQIPAAAPEVAYRIGARSAAAFDISAGCAGFVYGLAVAADMVRSRSGRVLVIGAERMTDLLDMEDRSTTVIFGDGAGAIVLGPGDSPGVGPVVWGGDGSKAGVISQTAPWSDVRSHPGIRWPALRQEGQSVFRWAAYELVDVGSRAMKEGGVEADQIDVFVPHQANLRIIDRLAKSLRLPATARTARDIVHMGNTSAASIPLAIDSMLASDEARSGDLALLLGFGAGLSYGAVVVAIP